MNVYMLVMQGGGDTEVKVVTKVIWDWVINPERPGRKGAATDWLDTSTPESVKMRLSIDGNSWRVTIGSYENDRALLACGIDVLYESYGDVSDIVQAVEWIKDNGHTLDETWEGCIY